MPILLKANLFGTNVSKFWNYDGLSENQHLRNQFLSELI